MEVDGPSTRVCSHDMIDIGALLEEFVSGAEMGSDMRMDLFRTNISSCDMTDGNRGQNRLGEMNMGDRQG